jgi:hypothetical protein
MPSLARSIAFDLQVSNAKILSVEPLEHPNGFTHVARIAGGLGELDGDYWLEVVSDLDKKRQ